MRRVHIPSKGKCPESRDGMSCVRAQQRRLLSLDHRVCRKEGGLECKKTGKVVRGQVTELFKCLR